MIFWSRLRPKRHAARTVYQTLVIFVRTPCTRAGWRGQVVAALNLFHRRAGAEEGERARALVPPDRGQENTAIFVIAGCPLVDGPRAIVIEPCRGVGAWENSRRAGRSRYQDDATGWSADNLGDGPASLERQPAFTMKTASRSAGRRLSDKNNIMPGSGHAAPHVGVTSKHLRQVWVEWKLAGDSSDQPRGLLGNVRSKSLNLATGRRAFSARRCCSLSSQTARHQLAAVAASPRGGSRNRSTSGATGLTNRRKSLVKFDLRRQLTPPKMVCKSATVSQPEPACRP